MSQDKNSKEPADRASFSEDAARALDEESLVLRLASTALQRVKGQDTENLVRVVVDALARTALSIQREGYDSQLSALHGVLGVLGVLGVDDQTSRPRGQKGIYRDLRQLVFERDGYTCRVCGKDVQGVDWMSSDFGELIHLDQVVEPSIENIVVGCRNCGSKRGFDSSHVAQLVAENRKCEGILDKDRKRCLVSEPNVDVRAVHDAFVSAAGENGVHAGGIPSVAFGVVVPDSLGHPSRRHAFQVSIDPSLLNEAEHHEVLLDPVLDVSATAQGRVNFELDSLVNDVDSHETSPSVGAPSGAGVGTSDPTGGDAKGVPGDMSGAPDRHKSGAPTGAQAAAGRPTREQCIQDAGAVLARAMQLYCSGPNEPAGTE